MNKTLKTILVFSVFICSCEDVDFSGFLYNSDPVNDRVRESLEWNKAHPDREVTVAGTDYSLLVAGDVHVGGTVNLEKMLSQTGAAGVACVVIAGDLTTGHSDDYVTLRDELETKSAVPAFVIAGNHDLFFNGWQTYREFFGSSTYSFTVKTDNASDLFICLDSGSSTHGWRQTEWLRNLLEEERSNYRYCILFTHVNLFRSNRTLTTSPLVEEVRMMIDLCSSNAVNMVIMGHDHMRAEELLGSTRYIILDALADSYEAASYLRLQVRPGSLTHTFVNL